MKSAAVLLAFVGSAMAFPTNCPNVTKLHDVKGDGWYDACLGLKYHPEPKTSEACKAQCYADMNCSVWQMIQEPNLKKCWSGNVVHGCLSRANEAKLANYQPDLIAGERIQHGFIKVVSENSAETMNLKHYPEKTGTEEEKIKRCQEFCYTDVTCTVWQYGGDGCWLEHYPTAPKHEQRPDSEWTKHMKKGQTIEHTCPPYVPPPEEGGTSILPIILGILAALGLLGLIAYLCMPKPKVKKTRQVKVEHKTPAHEPDEPASPVMYFVPQPTVLIPRQSSIVVPQTSVAPVAQYQPVATAAPMAMAAQPVMTAAPVSAPMTMAAPMTAAPTATYAAPMTSAPMTAAPQTMTTAMSPMTTAMSPMTTGMSPMTAASSVMQPLIR